MIAILRSDQKLTESDMDLMRGQAKKDLALGGFGEDVSVMILGAGTDFVLIGDNGCVIFSTQRNWRP